MKKGWKYVKLEDCLAKVPKQHQIKSKYYKDFGLFPIVSQEAGLINGYCDDKSCVYEHSKPVIIFGDHTKNIKYVDFDFVVGADGVHILMPKDDYNSKFFYYYLKSVKLRNLGYARHYKLLKEKDVPIPPLPEQEEIVRYLDEAFMKIDAMKEKAEEALEEAKALFQSALTEMMTPKKGWEEKTLGEIALDMYRGSGIKRDQIRATGIPCVRYGEIYTIYDYAFDTCVSHTDEELIDSKKYFEHGDILFTITGESIEEIGKSVAYLGHEKCLLGGDLVAMKHKENPKYLSYALSTPEAIKQKGFGKTKLKVVHTNIPSLKSITIPLPPLPEQEAIVSRLDAISERVKIMEENYSKTVEECDAMKQAMLREVFE